MVRPNILFLMSDEHRADVAGFAGNEVVRTPFLDKLAETGVVFENAYAPSPICVPSRQCMMAGQLPKTCNCEGWIDLEPGYLTFSRLFSQYAYETICCGKLHHQGFDQMQGWTQRPAGDLQVTPNYIKGAIPEEYAKYQRPFGDYKWTDSKEVKRAGAGTGRPAAGDREWTDAAKRAAETYFNDITYDREQSRKPLMLKLSLLEPHYQYMVDEEKFGYYLNRVPVYLDEPVSEHPFLSQRQVRPGLDASPRELRRATAAYYGMIENIDSMYAEMAEMLEYVGENLDDWIIIYTSDHGEMLGQHGIWEKQKFYEGSVRVPLIVRWPKGFAGGQRISQNVSTCDIYATLCELTGIPMPKGLDSRSLVPLLNGNTEGWFDEAVSQFSLVNVPVPAGLESAGKLDNVMIKQGALKYQWYAGMPEVLFDLEKNPEETIDYSDDPAYADSMAHFRQRLAELGHGPQADMHYINAGYNI